MTQEQKYFNIDILLSYFHVLATFSAYRTDVYVHTFKVVEDCKVSILKQETNCQKCIFNYFTYHQSKYMLYKALNFAALYQVSLVSVVQLNRQHGSQQADLVTPEICISDLWFLFQNTQYTVLYNLCNLILKV